MDSRIVPHSLIGLLALSLGLACTFSPHPKSGAQACSPGDNLCPEGYLCETDHRCWLAGDALVDAGPGGHGGGAGQMGSGASGGNSAASGATGGIPSADSNFVLTTVGAGQSPAIAVDKSGSAHIAYFNYDQGKIRYATNRSGSWVIADIATANLAPNNIGASLAEATPSIAVDSNGNVHISYYEATYVFRFGVATRLQYVTNKSGSWVTVDLSYSYYFGMNSSIAAGPNGEVYVVYPWSDCIQTLAATDAPVDCNNEVRLSTNESGSWRSYPVLLDPTTIIGPYTYFPGYGYDAALRIALDSNTHLHVVSSQYSSQHASKIVNYSTNVSGTWKTTAVEETTDNYDYHWPSLAISRGSIPVVAYYGDNAVRIATNSTGTWTPFVTTNGSFAQSTGCMPRIAIDASDWIYVVCPGRVDVYGPEFSGTLVGSLGSTQLSGMTVGTYTLGVTTVLALDTKDKVHIAYQSSGGQIMYVTNK